ncbi:unnamed protein product, partial [Amoebophrya sp. A120]
QQLATLLRHRFSETRGDHDRGAKLQGSRGKVCSGAIGIAVPPVGVAEGEGDPDQITSCTKEEKQLPALSGLDLLPCCSDDQHEDEVDKQARGEITRQEGRRSSSRGESNKHAVRPSKHHTATVDAETQRLREENASTRQELDRMLAECERRIEQATEDGRRAGTEACEAVVVSHKVLLAQATEELEAVKAKLVAEEGDRRLQAQE